MSSHWQSVCISPNSSIRDALALINKGALRTALVVEEHSNFLLGVITDGDIRRGLLRNLSLDALVSDVMNAQPITADINLCKEKLRQVMLKNGLLSLPLIEDGMLAGLEVLNDIFTKKNYENPVFLMAGGFGTRLQPLTDDCPKPMLKVGEKPILEIILQSFIQSGFVNFFISTHYLPEKIHDHFADGSKWGVNITYVHEGTPLGTAGALGLLPSSQSNLPIIMMNGDILTQVDFHHLLECHQQHNADATMCVRKYHYQIPYGVVQYDKNKITSIVEKPKKHFFVNAGVYVISQALAKTVYKNQRIDMTSLLEDKMNAGGNVAMFPIHEYWLDIGRIEDYTRAQIDIDMFGYLDD